MLGGGWAENKKHSWEIVSQLDPHVTVAGADPALFGARAACGKCLAPFQTMNDVMSIALALLTAANSAF